jgi:hypothetical protein
MRIEPRHNLTHSSLEDQPVPIDELTAVLNEVVPPETRGIQEFASGMKPLKESSIAVLFKRPACDSLPKYADPDWLESP